LATFRVVIDEEAAVVVAKVEVAENVAGEAVVKFPETYRLEVVADVRVALVAVRLVKAAVRAVRRAEKKLVVVALVREAFSE
jgi:hypothetical protein